MRDTLKRPTSTLSSVLLHHRADRIRALADLKEERSVGAPDIPTATEGAGRRIAYTFNIILAPAQTRRGIIDRLGSVIRQVMAECGFTDTLIEMGVDPILKSDRAAALLRTEIARYKPIIHALARKH